MNYTIEKANLEDGKIELEIRELIKAAFNEKVLLKENHILTNVNSASSKPSFFLVAKENGNIIGCNGFLANDFFLNGEKIVGYQSCWTATHPDHQGKRVFVNILNEAKKILQEDGAGFIYGIPNNNSHPIFINKLGFAEFPAMMTRIPNLPFFTSFYLNPPISYKGGISIDEEQVKNHKLRQFPQSIKVVTHKESWLWGKLIEREKFGIKYSVFLVGGVSINDQKDMRLLFSNIFKTYHVLFTELVSCNTNVNNGLIKGWKQSRGMNGFIFFNLNLPESTPFNIMIGAIDVF